MAFAGPKVNRFILNAQVNVNSNKYDDSVTIFYQLHFDIVQTLQITVALWIYHISQCGISATVINSIIILVNAVSCLRTLHQCHVNLSSCWHRHHLVA